VARRGLRLGDLYNAERFAVKLKEVMEYHNFSLKNYYGVDEVSYEETLASCMDWSAQIKDVVVDAVNLVHEIRENGGDIMFEGAQGTLLDITTIM